MEEIIMEPQTAKDLINEVVENDFRDWVITDLVDFIWDGSNRFRVRDFTHADVDAFGSTTVVQCLVHGNVGPAVTQQLSLSMAEAIRNRKDQ